LDTNIVIFLSLAKDRIKLRISFIPIGSNPLVGSSNISSFGLWRSALAIPSLCFIPKEYLPTSFFVSLCRSTISKASSIVFFFLTSRIFVLIKIFFFFFSFSYIYIFIYIYIIILFIFIYFIYL